MGNPSELRFVPASISATPIDWTRISEASKKFLIEKYGYDYEKKDYKPLPATIEDLAKLFDNTKFFGYLRPDILTILMDISEFGLKPTPPIHIASVGPRFYMTYCDQVWFLLFTPGTRECVMGCSDEIIRDTNDDDDDDDDDAVWAKMAADEAAMARAFDVTLEREVSRGMGGLVEFTGKLGGWAADMLQFNLEYVQYIKAIGTLPKSHPVYRRVMKDVFDSFKK